MNSEILKKLSEITDEEKEILKGRTQIDRTIYMDGSHDVISGEKLLGAGRPILQTITDDALRAIAKDFGVTLNEAFSTNRLCIRKQRPFLLWYDITQWDVKRNYKKIF